MVPPNTRMKLANALALAVKSERPNKRIQQTARVVKRKVVAL
jgi:hypothetical protein